MISQSWVFTAAPKLEFLAFEQQHDPELLAQRVGLGQAQGKNVTHAFRFK